MRRSPAQHTIPFLAQRVLRLVVLARCMPLAPRMPQVLARCMPQLPRMPQLLARHAIPSLARCMLPLATPRAPRRTGPLGILALRMLLRMARHAMQARRRPLLLARQSSLILVRPGQPLPARRTTSALRRLELAAWRTAVRLLCIPAPASTLPTQPDPTRAQAPVLPRESAGRSVFETLRLPSLPALRFASSALSLWQVHRTIDFAVRPGRLPIVLTGLLLVHGPLPAATPDRSAPKRPHEHEPDRIRTWFPLQASLQSRSGRGTECLRRLVPPTRIRLHSDRQRRRVFARRPGHPRVEHRSVATRCHGR